MVLTCPHCAHFYWLQSDFDVVGARMLQHSTRTSSIKTYAEVRRMNVSGMSRKGWHIVSIAGAWGGCQDTNKKCSERISGILVGG